MSKAKQGLKQPVFVPVASRIGLAFAQALGLPEENLMNVEFTARPDSGVFVKASHFMDGDTQARAVAAISQIDPEAER